MPLGSRTRRGRNGHGGGRVDWGRPKPREELKVFGATPAAGQTFRECPTCHRQVGVRMGGSIRSHRVGPDRQRSWPCPGEERPTL